MGQILSTIQSSLARIEKTLEYQNERLENIEGLSLELRLDRLERSNHKTKHTIQKVAEYVWRFFLTVATGFIIYKITRG